MIVEKITRFSRYIFGFLLLYYVANSILDRYKTWQLVLALREKANLDIQSVKLTSYLFGAYWELSYFIYGLLIILALLAIPPTNAYIEKKTNIQIGGKELVLLVVALILIWLLLITLFLRNSFP